MAASEAKDDQTPQQKFEALKNEFTLTDEIIATMRTNFNAEMERGLADEESSLKMLSTCVYSLPGGDETGVYYSMDWGGTNYRVLRCEFFGKDKDPVVQETKVKITEEYQHTREPAVLFDHLAQVLQEHMTGCGELGAAEAFPIGFTFSFPMRQPALEEAILINWTKGFDIPGVEGQSITSFMHQAFDRQGVAARIRAVCNDTTGTLLACAFEFPSTRVGLILGTGINAAYVEPQKGGEIINTELGGFSLVPRTDIDTTIDAYTPNPGAQFLEKMVSGFYLGEIARVSAVAVFGERLTSTCAPDARILTQWGLESAQVSRVLDDTTEKLFLVNDILNEHGVSTFTEEERALFRDVCQLVVNRSADLAATAVSCVCQRMNLSGTVTVGIDGSVYKYMHGYEARMKETLGRILGMPQSSCVNLVHASDGSGKGAALVAAASLKASS